MNLCEYYPDLFVLYYFDKKLVSISPLVITFYFCRRTKNKKVPRNITIVHCAYSVFMIFNLKVFQYPLEIFVKNEIKTRLEIFSKKLSFIWILVWCIVIRYRTAEVWDKFQHNATFSNIFLENSLSMYLEWIH